jgi:nitrogen fixation/metabolism regulation signal transduction histidine kinase
LARMFQDFQFRMGPAALLLVFLTGFQAIVASHRVAGPLYRLRRALETLTAGDFSMRIRLRRFDQFREFEGLVNSLADKLEADRKVLRSKAQELEASLANPGEQVRAREILAELKRGLT